MIVLVLSLLGGSAARLDAQVVLIDFGETWNYLKGTAAPSTPDTAWKERGFVDDAWDEGPLGIGYGDGDDATVLGDMMQVADDPLTPEVDESQPGYSTVYVRKTFNVSAAQLGTLTSLLLTANYDDGFVCYINGLEAARANAGTPGTDLAFNAVAGPAREPATEFFDVSSSILNLVAGENVIAVQVLNAALTSSDLSFNARLTGNDPIQACPTALGCTVGPASITLSWTNNGTYDSIRVTRDGVDIAGSPFPGGATSAVDSSPGDFNNTYEVIAAIGAFNCPPLACNTLPPGTALIEVGEDWLFFRGTVAPSEPPTAWREPGFNDDLWETGATGIGYGDGDDTTVLTDMQMTAAQAGYMSFFCRRTFSVSDLGSIGSLTLEVDYDDGFIAYMNGAEVARSGSMGTPGTEFTFDQASGMREAGTAETFTLPTGSLRSGENLLAVEVHNSALNSSDASFIPRLIARTSGPSGNNRPTARIRVTPATTVRLAQGTASVTADGTTSDDGEAGAQGLTSQWSKLSGPAGDTIATPANATTGVSFTMQGAYRYQLLVNDGQSSNNTDTEIADITVLPEGGEIFFRRGDVNNNGSLNLSDGVQVFNFLFLGGTAPTCFDAADADDSGNINLTDGVRVLNFLFLGGTMIPPPGNSTCGPDGTPGDPLSCVQYDC